MMDYSVEELELLDAIEGDLIQSIPFNNEEKKLMAKETRQYNQEKKQISINLKRADNIGIPYQNVITYN